MQSDRGKYEYYYTSQSISGVAIFQGSAGQRGHGLGSMLSGRQISSVGQKKKKKKNKTKSKSKKKKRKKQNSHDIFDE